MGLDYAHEKLMAAVDSLDPESDPPDTPRPSVQERLQSIGRWCFLTLQARDLEGLEGGPERFERIRTAARRSEALSDEEAKDVAEEIRSLHDDVASALGIEEEETNLPKDLAPGRYESEGDYLDRVRGHFPGTPDEVLAQWHYRHWPELDSLCSWLPLRSLAYKLTTLTRERVLALRSRMDIHESRDGGYWGQSLLEPGSCHYRHPIAEPTRQKGTFGQRVILLDPAGIELPDDFPPGDEVYLLEGHMRLCFLKALILDRDLRGDHEAWLASL